MSAKNDRFPWSSVIAGSVVFGVVFVAAIVLSVLTAPRYRSSPELLVAPDRDLGRELEAEYYDVIDQGTTVQNFAEVLRGDEVRDAALELAGVEKKRRQDVKIEIVVPTETSILRLQVTAPDKETSIEVASVLQDESVETLADMETPLVIKPVATAAQQVERTGLSRPATLMIGFLAAVVLGIAAQQAIVQLAWISRDPEP